MHPSACLRLVASRRSSRLSAGSLPRSLNRVARRCQSSGTKSHTEAQKAAYDFYRKRQEETLWFKIFGRRQRNKPQRTLEERNVATAYYMTAMLMGALAATYAAVPLYKVFCQTTGFGGTTQRVQIVSPDEEQAAGAQPGGVETLLRSVVSNMPGVSSAKVHTWTDEEAAAKLASLKPVKSAELVTVRFDTTVDDRIPWSFEPVQLEVKIVPGETALSFFRVTNHSDKAITGVATYNVHPPKMGLYFQKIQCFCFEEQRLLPGETVDMPVFFFLDPEVIDDAQVSYIREITLSYTFFQTDEDDENDLEDDDEDED